MSRVMTFAMLLVASHATTAISSDAPAQPARELRSPQEFSQIADPPERSVALFEEAGRVLQDPRCLNCHPVHRSPTQGADLHPHNPPILAGSSGQGLPGLPCKSCHGSMNSATHADSIRSVPGNPHWALAPASMAWQGKSLGEICVQLKDSSRNGGRTLAQIQEHVEKDHLVGWAWSPGDGRDPAPGTQLQFGALIREWIGSGAHCPPR